MNNPVAKYDHNKGGAHRDKKRHAKKDRRKQKHKGGMKGADCPYFFAYILDALAHMLCWFTDN